MNEGMTQLKKCTVCHQTFILEPLLLEDSFRFTEDQCSWACYDHHNYMMQLQTQMDPQRFGVMTYI